MAERILRAYFSEGQNISDADTLAVLAAEVGVETVENAKSFLHSTEGIEAVRAMEKQVSLKGIHGVPALQIGVQTIPGAQSVSALVSAFQKAADKRKVASR